MKDRIFQLTVNGKVLGKVTGKADLPRGEFINYVKGLAPDFNETKDILEVTDLTPPEAHKVLRHKARDKSANNKMIDVILSRHVSNLIATYGEAKLFKLLSEVYGVTKPESKAS